MLKRRLFSLTATAIVVVPATVLTALAATSASATTAVAASSHSAAASDCVYITDYQASLNAETQVGIAGNGVNEPVTLANSLGNCFTVLYPFSHKFPDGTTYSGYEYQNGDGHCLWNNGGILDVGGACAANHPNEEFFGYEYLSGLGWLEGNVAIGDSAYVNAQYCDSGSEMGFADNASCGLLNFPPG